MKGWKPQRKPSKACSNLAKIKIGCQLLIAEGYVYAQGSQYGICSGQSDTVTKLSLASSVFLLVLFHCCSIFIHVSTAGWTVGLLAIVATEM
jgi:hypothetical protein